MANYTAADVKKLRELTGAGMMDCKKALDEAEGNVDKAVEALRIKGQKGVAKREGRSAENGAVVSIIADDNTSGVLVELKCETDFVASSEHFKQLASDLASLVALRGESATEQRAKELEDLRITLKEKIELGDVVRIEAGDGHVLESYLHVQGGRGVNAVLVELDGGTSQLAHDVAVHIAFARPKYLSKDDVPADVVAKERETLTALSRNEGKPEQALPKIVEGRLGGFFKEVALLEQPYAKDDKQTIKQILGKAEVIRFAQVEIG